MATLISLYKDNRITSSEVESKDIDIVLGFLFKTMSQEKTSQRTLTQSFSTLRTASLK